LFHPVKPIKIFIFFALNILALIVLNCDERVSLKFSDGIGGFGFICWVVIVF